MRPQPAPVSQAFWVSAASQTRWSASCAQSGLNMKSRPSAAPGSVTARTARITTRTTRLGMSTRATFSIPRTPQATTTMPSAIATAWVSKAPDELLKRSQNAPGGPPGISPVSVATK